MIGSDVTIAEAITATDDDVAAALLVIAREINKHKAVQSEFVGVVASGCQAIAGSLSELAAAIREHNHNNTKKKG